MTEKVLMLPPPPPPPPAHVVPFTLQGGHILLEATVNGVRATLILDTGSSASTLDRDWATPLALPPIAGRASVEGTQSTEVTLATVKSVRIADFELTDEPVVLLPLDTTSRSHGRRIDGTLGYPFFSKWVVAIDYGARELRLYVPSTFEYDGDGTVVALDLSMRVPIVQGFLSPTPRDSIPVRLLLDLGTSGFAGVFTAPFEERFRKRLDALPSRPLRLDGGVGAGIPSRVLRPHALSLGSLLVKQPIIAVARESAGALGLTWFDGTLGAPVLERTTLILDYGRQRAMLEPTSNFGRTFQYDASGLDLATDPPDFETIRVNQVSDDSPAAEAGIAVGDQLVAVDGVRVSGAALWTILTQLTEAGALRTLTFRRDGTDRVVKLRLRRLL